MAYHAPRQGEAAITPNRLLPGRLRGRRQTALYLLLFGLGAALVLAVALASGALGEQNDRQPGASMGAGGATPAGTAAAPANGPTPTLPGRPSAAPQPSAAAGQSPAPDPNPTLDLAADLPIVPVVGFWSPQGEISLEELRLALEGRSAEYARVVVPQDERKAIAQALGVSLGSEVESGDAAAIRRAVREGALGLLRVDDVTPAVRALALEGNDLFGNGRLPDLADWPLLTAAEELGRSWSQAASWTLVAGGDIQLDRWMAHHVTELGKGVDWPWDGGTVRITGRVCCSDLGHRVPEGEPSGDPGAVRALFSQADLALANLEAAAVDDPAFHRLPANFPLSLNFSGDPRLLDGLKNAGFDFLSLANNHIHNAGDQGIADTRRNLRERDIAFAGAGRNLEQATRPAELEAGGQRVVVLPCITVGRAARADRAGSAPCTGNGLLRQIREAAASADLVIVFPHWGREYRVTPNAGQRALARAWADAGAGLVLGAHPHWVGSVEEIGQTLVFYSLGNLAFDQPWSEATMQGLIAELTYNGDRLVQVRLHPTLIVEHVQPNLLEYDAGGRRVLERMRDASDGLLPY